ncbi:hypothetical protein AO361_05950 [Pseudomonas fluorescens]|uniref:hypothetical protein n=1 Tax=Pseudomonas fluorescens TaxID=294 RepID=UPI000709A8DD|nr:hypothetical protein [Pseudomonas fluorescens]OOQ42734.1 hypothetical protein AO361_05950 [Pseudomonas fluorescens]
MNDECGFITVKLKVARAGIAEFKLPLEADGTLHPSLEPFRSIESLNELWDRFDGQLIDKVVNSPDDSDSMQTLLSLLVDDRVGPGLLSALREFRRRQRLKLMKRLEDHGEVNGGQGSVDDRDPETVVRTLNRKKERLKKGL